MWDWLTYAALVDTLQGWLPIVAVPIAFVIGLSLVGWLASLAVEIFRGALGGGAPNPGGGSSGPLRPSRLPRPPRPPKHPGESPLVINSWSGLEQHARENNDWDG